MSEMCWLIPLTQGQYAVVDAADYHKVSRHKWTAHFHAGQFKAVRNDKIIRPGKQTKIYMSRVIMDAPTGMEVDHENHDTLDNRRFNLRVVTHHQNLLNRRHRNSTGFKGVSKARDKWKAEIKIGDKRVRLGTFSSPQEAHARYAEAAVKYHGEFACTERLP